MKTLNLIEPTVTESLKLNKFKKKKNNTNATQILVVL